MRILFLGGTKFFGKLIVQELIKQNHDVTVVSRTVGWGDQIVGDRSSPEVLKQLTCHWDVVIDNIAYNANDVRTILKHVTTKHYILTSTIGVYYPNATDSDYAANKLEAERVLYELSDVTMRWTIVRPGIVYGAGDPLKKSLWYLERILNKKPICLSFGSPVSFVFSEDIPSFYTRLIDSRMGGCFDLCNPELMTITRFVETHMNEMACDYVPSKHPWNAGPYGYSKPFIGHPEHAMRFLDWKPTPWEEAVRKTIPWFEEQLKNEGSKSHP